MKTYLLKPMVVVCLCLLTASFTFAADNYKMVKVKAPFPMQPIKVFIYPDKDFLITDYGAKNGGEVNNTKAIAAAIEANLGIGYARLHYDKYKCQKCGEKIGTESRNYFGPTKAGISLIYYLK